MQSVITKEMLLKASNAEKCRMMIKIIKGAARYEKTEQINEIRWYFQ